MATGMALTIGLNSVDPGHYAGWSGDLVACEADAEDMAEIAKSRKFKVKTLLTKAATRAQVAGEISRAAGTLASGDIFLLSYSGHGGQVPDRDGEEEDAQDETWCLYDGQMLDDEINAALGKFAQGVRVLVFSDSCHSGTVTREAYYNGTMALRGPAAGSRAVRYRCMPREMALRVYRRNKAFYDAIQKTPGLADAEESVKASVLLISGCQDNQTSADGDFNGLFTANLLRVWNDGAFRKGYKAFHKAILKRMPPDQSPNYFRVGAYDRKFEAERPFTV